MTEMAFEKFETERLIIRRFNMDDLAALLAYRSDPEVYRLQGWGGSYSEKSARQFIEMMQDGTPGQPGWYNLALERKSDGVLVGDCALRIDRGNPLLGEVGYTLAHAFWGKGYASEAVERILIFAFEERGMHRIMADTDPENIGSIKLLERFGFRREAHHVQSYWDGQEWRDDYIYAMLGHEWHARKKA